MPATIRRATPDDAEQIARIIDEVVAEPDPVAFDRPWTAAEVRSWMERQGENGAMFVVDDGRHVLAFAAMDFDSSRPEECTFGAWVRERNRRQGHGTALAEEALAFARQRGYKRIRARLPERNEPALSFLSSIGALVPLMNPGTAFVLPIYQDGEERQ
ncbi:MAG: GNAT family N-acetyltransferase [Chloroflexi bacterium]|nr:GNAT family N-acetyltransferase [Chloroflexota bacterium]